MKKEDIFELSENEKLRIENKELKEKYAHSEDRILALERLVARSVYPIKLKGQEAIQNEEDLEFCIAGIVSGYESKIKYLEKSNYEHRLAKEITNYKKEVERLNELLKEKSNENNISINLNKGGISFIDKKKASFVSTDTNSVGTSNNKDSLTSLDKIKQKDTYLYKAINGLIEYISLCYSDKYYKDGNFTDMDKFMMESEYSDGFIIGNMAKYLTRYSGDLNKLVDLYKLIHYGLLSLRKKFKDNEK